MKKVTVILFGVLLIACGSIMRVYKPNDVCVCNHLASTHNYETILCDSCDCEGFFLDYRGLEPPDSTKYEGVEPEFPDSTVYDELELPDSTSCVETGADNALLPR